LSDRSIYLYKVFYNKKTLFYQLCSDKQHDAKIIWNNFLPAILYVLDSNINILNIYHTLTYSHTHTYSLTYSRTHSLSFSLSICINLYQ